MATQTLVIKMRKKDLDTVARDAARQILDEMKLNGCPGCRARIQVGPSPAEARRRTAQRRARAKA